ncbi:MAG: acyl-CoA dehydrogenase family protein [Acidimicrobiales bacterium]
MRVRVTISVVDFTFSPEQDALRDTVRAYLAKSAPPSYVRKMIDDERGFTDGWWDGLSALGWPGLLIPEALGGAGLGMIDMVVLQEEMGKLPLPGPFLSSAVAGTLAARRLGDEELLSRLSSGTVRATVAFEEAGSGDPLDSVTATAAPAGDGWALSGAKPLVIDGHTAHVAVVAARTDDGLAAFALESPGGTLVPSLDVTRKVARVDLDGRVGRRLGAAGDQTDVLRRIGDDIAIAVCAETVGACDRALEMAIEYSKARVQFDRPIATFQAIKHKIVDMLHQLELSRVGTHWAAWASEVDDRLRAESAAMCKGFVGEAANMITAENIQVHGGVGFTWDVDCHLLFRRVKQNDVLFGRQGWQRRRLADLVLGPA